MGHESYELQTNDIYAFQDYSDQYGIQVKSPFADQSSYVETLCKRINNGLEFCVDVDLETVKEIAKGAGKAAEEAIKEFGEFVGEVIGDTAHVIGEVGEAVGEIVVDVAALPLEILGAIFGSELIQPVELNLYLQCHKRKKNIEAQLTMEHLNKAIVTIRSILHGSVYGAQSAIATAKGFILDKKNGLLLTNRVFIKDCVNYIRAYIWK